MTSQTMKKSLKRHAPPQKIAGGLAGMVIILMFLAPTFSLFQHIYERTSPQEWWFEYQDVTPFHNEFKKGQKIEFISVAEYKKELDVQWFDTLWCDLGGRHKRLKTQITPDHPTRKLPGLVGQPDDEGIYPTWEYRAEPIPANADACRLESYIVATTPLGYQKTMLFIGDWFPVNK